MATSESRAAAARLSGSIGDFAENHSSPSEGFASMAHPLPEVGKPPEEGDSGDDAKATKAI